MSVFSGVDENRTCRNCQNPFVFTVGEQQWMEERGLNQAPNKCKPCRKQARDARNGNSQQPSESASSNSGNPSNYNTTKDASANPSNYNTQRPSKSAGYIRPAPLTEQKVTPTDYRKADEDEWGNRRNRRDGGKRRRSRDGYNNDDGDW